MREVGHAKQEVMALSAKFNIGVPKGPTEALINKLLPSNPSSIITPRLSKQRASNQQNLRRIAWTI
jgi:hypothetical protein